jgi:hypothetical protein
MLLGCLLGAAFALVVHYEHPAGCSVRPAPLGGTVTTCGQRGDLIAVLVPSLFVGAGLGMGLALLGSRRED